MNVFYVSVFSPSAIFCPGSIPIYKRSTAPAVGVQTWDAAATWDTGILWS